MAKHNLVAMYNLRDEAERARDELLRFGIPAEKIRLSPANVEPASFSRGALRQEPRGGFWDWLFGDDIPQHDQSWYGARLGEGRTALSVLIDDEALRDQVAEILERSNPIDFDESAVEERGRGALNEPAMTAPVIGPAASGLEQSMRSMPAAQPGIADRSEMRAEASEMPTEGEQVIPVVKEELAVGKRAAERRYRIRTYTVETPVEENVRLHDERVVIERRPATSGVAADPDAARDREFEVVERHEEPVVEKHVRPVEEVVVRREAADRVETVRDTVRETKVDVDKEPMEHRVGAETGRLGPEPRVDIEKDRGSDHHVDLEERKP